MPNGARLLSETTVGVVHRGAQLLMNWALKMAVVPKRKRPIEWTAMETEVLIYVWGENISDLRRAKRNRHVYEKIRNELEAEHKIYRTAAEVKTKIDNLSKFYRKEKKLKQSPNCSQSEWKFFSPINAFLGSCSSQEDDERLSVITQDVSVVLNSANNCGETIYDITPTTSTCGENTSASENSVLTTSHPQRSCAKITPKSSRGLTPGKKRRKRFAEEVLSTVQSILQRQMQVEDDLRKNDDVALKLLERQTELQEQSVQITRSAVFVLYQMDFSWIEVMMMEDPIFAPLNHGLKLKIERQLIAYILSK